MKDSAYLKKLKSISISTGSKTKSEPVQVDIDIGVPELIDAECIGCGKKEKIQAMPVRMRRRPRKNKSDEVSLSE